jgi:hypothetical protein
MMATIKGCVRGELARDPEFAGNVQRTIETFWRMSVAALHEDACVLELADFAIRNIDVSAYHHLVARPSIDCSQMAAKCSAHWGD